MNMSSESFTWSGKGDAEDLTTSAQNEVSPSLGIIPYNTVRSMHVALSPMTNPETARLYLIPAVVAFFYLFWLYCREIVREIQNDNSRRDLEFSRLDTEIEQLTDEVSNIFVGLDTILDYYEVMKKNPKNGLVIEQYYEYISAHFKLFSAEFNQINLKENSVEKISILKKIKEKMNAFYQVILADLLIYTAQVGNLGVSQNSSTVNYN